MELSVEKLRQLAELPGADALAGKSAEDDTWLPLWMHCADTAGVFLHLLKEWLPAHTMRTIRGSMESEELERLCTFIALAHDIGKVTVPFQKKLRLEGTEREARLNRLGLLTVEDKRTLKHAQAGESILITAGYPVRVCTVIGAHHGMVSSIPSEGDPLQAAKGNVAHEIGDSRANGRKTWVSVRTAWADAFRALAGYDDVGSIPDISFRQQVLLTGLLIMADWLASNTEYFPLLTAAEQGDPALYPERIETGWSRVSLPDRWTAEATLKDAARFAERFGFAPNGVQRAVLDVVNGMEEPGILILEAQMGVGKTEAALAAAEQLIGGLGSGGMYFGLPTQATANGIFPRLLSWAENVSGHEGHSIRLAHRMAELNDDYRAIARRDASVSGDGVFVHDWFRGRKQTMLSEFVIGTVDQFLMASLRQKHVMLRHLGLAGKVAVIDECHAYDAYMNTYLDRTLEWLAAYRVPVLLLSATLPAERRAQIVRAYLRGRGVTSGIELPELDAYPLITWTDGNEAHQRRIAIDTPHREVRIRRIVQDELPQLLKEAMQNGGAAGVICNTVRRAQETAARLRRELPDREIMLCHAQYLAEDRAEWERELMRRVGKRSTPETRDGLIVVGTSVLEQSLDIDLDLLATELCPMDLLLQRVGRLHRHPRSRPQGLEEACCCVICPEDEFDPASAAIYGKWLLHRTSEELTEHVWLPDDISPLVQRVYMEPEQEDPTGYHAEYRRQEADKRNRAMVWLVGGPEDMGLHGSTPMYGWLDGDAGNTESADATVRDSISSIEVLVLVRHADGTVFYLPWREGGRSIRTDIAPNGRDALAVARQGLRLPFALTSPWSFDRTMRQLTEKHPMPEAWRECSMLRGAQLMLLDEQLETRLGGYLLRYDRRTGLTTIKEDKDDT